MGNFDSLPPLKNMTAKPNDKDQPQKESGQAGRGERGGSHGIACRRWISGPKQSPYSASGRSWRGASCCHFR